ncbi:hypothetical protein HMPREF3039_01149 [Akkermansia sp. KLE1798]|nr:hypothetical protein HMPREF3039_01149 [Akkermansia sp. KLE1798]
MDAPAIFSGSPFNVPPPSRPFHPSQMKNSRSGHFHGTAVRTGRQDRFNGWLPEPA